MTNDEIKRLRSVYDVECPRCGARPSVHFIGNSFQVTSCGHKELTDEIAAREKSAFLH